MGEGGALVIVLKELYEACEGKMLEQIKAVVNREINESISVGVLRDLTPPASLDFLLNFLTDLLSSSTLSHPSNNEYPTKARSVYVINPSGIISFHFPTPFCFLFLSLMSH